MNEIDDSSLLMSDQKALIDLVSSAGNLIHHININTKSIKPSVQ